MWKICYIDNNNKQLHWSESYFLLDILSEPIEIQ